MLSALALLLGACGASGPTWIPAPLVADSSRDVQTNGQDRPFDEHLLVSEDAYAELKFSLDTLPGGVMSSLVIADGTASIGTGNYSLTPEKVFRARLVLFVDQIFTDGYIKIDGAYTSGSDCFALESVRPSCAQTVTGTTLANDADAPAQALRITQRGYYSFDVTQLVKERLIHGYAGILRIRSVRDPQTNDWGHFLFASKEKIMGQAFVQHHQPQLLVTLVDAAGDHSSAFITTTVQNSQSDPSSGNRDYSQQPDMFTNGDPAEIAYVLAQPRGLPTGGLTIKSFLDQVGTRAYKVTMTSTADAPVPFSAPSPARIDWYRRGKLNNPANNNNVITWNNGWSEPPPGALIASNLLVSDLPTQRLQTDISVSYVAAMQGAYASNATSVNFAVAGKTNVQGPITLEARYNAQTAHAPRFTTVVTPIPVNGFYVYDANDSTRAIQYCIGRVSTGAQCNTPLSLRARAGQPYASPIIVDIRSLDGDTNVPYAAPIHIDVPPAGPSAALETDPSPDSQALAVGIADAPGYYISLGRANATMGTFKGIISMPGHNARAEIQFENLPLPSAALSGPARVSIPAGSTLVTVPVDAAMPFVLHVADPVVNANIDDTTKWLFSSSDPSDTMPGETQRTDGQVNLAMSFGSVGPRTLTVRSKGDNAITATLDVIVDLQSTTALDAQSAIPVVGQPFNLIAMVTDHAGEAVPGGTVAFHVGAALLGSADIEGGIATLSVSMPTAGAYLFTASYDGDEASSIGGSVSAAESFAVDSASTTITFAAHEPVFVNDPVAVTTTLGVVAPGAGTPSGTLTISDGEVSCTFEVSVANGCALTFATAGARTLTASYAGDANFNSTVASTSLVVLHRPLLAASVDDGGGYVRYGRVNDYTVTIRNEGLGEATAFPINTTLSAAFDAAFAHWQCFGAGAGASCATSGTGPLHDVATIPPGRSLTWLVSVPVLHETEESEAVLTLDIGGVDPHQIVDITRLVLLRDGFDEAYASGSQMIEGNDGDSILKGERVQVFSLPARTDQRIDDVLALRSEIGEIRVQRGWLDATTALLRLSSRQAGESERVSAWVRTDTAATLAMTGFRAGDGTTHVILEGAETAVTIAFGVAK